MHNNLNSINISVPAYDGSSSLVNKVGVQASGVFVNKVRKISDSAFELSRELKKENKPIQSFFLKGSGYLFRGIEKLAEQAGDKLSSFHVSNIILLLTAISIFFYPLALATPIGWVMFGISAGGVAIGMGMQSYRIYKVQKQRHLHENIEELTRTHYETMERIQRHKFDDITKGDNYSKINKIEERMRDPKKLEVKAKKAYAIKDVPVGLAIAAPEVIISFAVAALTANPIAYLGAAWGLIFTGNNAINNMSMVSQNTVNLKNDIALRNKIFFESENAVNAQNIKDLMDIYKKINEEIDQKITGNNTGIRVDKKEWQLLEAQKAWIESKFAHAPYKIDDYLKKLEERTKNLDMSKEDVQAQEYHKKLDKWETKMQKQYQALLDTGAKQDTEDNEVKPTSTTSVDPEIKKILQQQIKAIQNQYSDIQEQNQHIDGLLLQATTLYRHLMRLDLPNQMAQDIESRKSNIKDFQAIPGVVNAISTHLATGFSNSQTLNAYTGDSSGTNKTSIPTSLSAKQKKYEERVNSYKKTPSYDELGAMKPPQDKNSNPPLQQQGIGSK